MQLEASHSPVKKESERHEPEQAIIQRYLSIIRTTAHSLSQSAVIEMGSTLLARVNQLFRILNEYTKQQHAAPVTNSIKSQEINL